MNEFAFQDDQREDQEDTHIDVTKEEVRKVLRNEIRSKASLKDGQICLFVYNNREYPMTILSVENKGRPMVVYTKYEDENGIEQQRVLDFGKPRRWALRNMPEYQYRDIKADGSLSVWKKTAKAASPRIGYLVREVGSKEAKFHPE